MTTEVYINGQLIDLDREEIVTATYGNISFGQLNKRKGVKSNTWKAPVRSPRNKLVFEGAELVNSDSIIPYRKGDIRVDIDGVTVFEGWCVLEKGNDFYEIQSFAGASDFYSQITVKKLTELNLSAWDHIWNEANIKNSWTRTEGYIYPYVEYGKGEPFYLEGSPPDFFFPQIFFSTVVKQIATDAGYTLEGKVLSNPRFKEHVILMNKFPTIRYGETWDMAATLPDLVQSKLWLDFANIYGLQFDINDALKIIRADYIDDLLFNEPEDWTNKVDRSEDRETEFHFKDYGQTSYLKYKAEELTPETPAYQDYGKEIPIDDQTLKVEADIYKSEFFMIQDEDTVLNPGINFNTRTYNTKEGKGYSGVWNSSRAYTSGIVFWNGTYYELVTGSTNQEPPNPTYWKAIAEKDVWDIKSRPMYGRVIVDATPVHYIAFDSVIPVPRRVTAYQMDWDYTYTHHYRVFDRVIRKSKIVEMLIKLNYSDINQLNFTRPKKIDGELFLLEEVSQYKLNQVDSTLCSFVRL